jgi:hypothetical protein
MKNLLAIPMCLLLAAFSCYEQTGSSFNPEISPYLQVEGGGLSHVGMLGSDLFELSVIVYDQAGPSAWTPSAGWARPSTTD